MAITERDELIRNHPVIGEVEFGIGEGKVPQSAHVAYFWETEKEFADGVRFLEAGLRGLDHCVIFGHEEANQAVCNILQNHGFEVKDLLAQQRITILGGNPSGEKILETIGGAFQQALARGTPLIRLLGNIGWGKSGWPGDYDLLAFEAKVTTAAKEFPCVVVCMYDVAALPGLVIRRGAYGTHPLIEREGSLQENPDYIPADFLLKHLELIADALSERRQAQAESRSNEERFRSLFDNSIDAVLIADPHGNIEAANPEACRLFGRTEEEICRIGRAGLVDPTDTRLLALLAERERTGRFKGELLFKRRDGSTFFGEVSSAFYKDKAGVAKASVIVRDVTERKRSQETLRDITEGTASVSGSDFFRSLVRHLAQALKVRYAFVAECTDDTKTRVRTLAFWAGEDFAKDVTFILRGTPCEKVIEGEVCCYPDHLTSLFPEDTELVTLKAQSYKGVPLYGSSGDVLGHLVVMDDKPMSDVHPDVPILRIFAARAGVELESKRAEEALRKSEERNRTLLDINNAIITQQTRDALLSAICEALGRVIPFDRLALSLYDPELHAFRIVAYAGPYHRAHYTPIDRVSDLNDSPVGWAFLNQKPLLRRDLETERQTSSEERAYGHGFRSLCAFPLVVRGKSIGGVTVGSLTRFQYTQADADFLMEVAKQIAIAIDKMKSYEEIAALNATIAATAERRRALLEINNAIITKLTREELFHAICEALGRVVPFDRVALTLYEPELDILRLGAFEGPFRSSYFSVGLALDPRDSHVGWTFLHQQPLLRRDLEAERQFSAEHRAFADGIRSMCALPLIVRGKSIGAINVASVTRCQYSESDAEFFQEVANQIAIAINNMQSYEEIVALKAKVEAESVYLQEEIKTEYNFEEIIGQSAPVRQLLRKVEQVALTETTVLIQGETGTGKELLARAIHNLSLHRERPLVKVNCGAIPTGLVESELFGHEKGAFTGALQQRVGRFELADGGTLFLDEVSELPPDTQTKLLRVLQEGEFERVGSSKTIKVNVRVIAATNRDLKEAVKAGTFRSDLFYRLNVFPLQAPALRERRADIALLVSFFLSRYAKRLGKRIHGVSNDTMDRLTKYAWPGNIRELQNVIERAVVVAEGPIVRIDESMLQVDSTSGDSGLITLEDMERAHIVRALMETNWVIHGNKGAASILGINPSTLRSRLQKLGIKKRGTSHKLSQS